MTRNNSLRYESDNGQILSAELCQCIPDPPVNQTVTITLARDEDSISSQWSSWQYDQCSGVLPNGTILAECGEGKVERRRLKDINSDKWEEEVEQKACPRCPHFLEQCFNYNVLDSPSRNFKNRNVDDCNGNWCCDKNSHACKTPDWKGPGWYRVTGQAGSKLRTRGTGVNKTCGTVWGGYLSSGEQELPRSGEGEVTRTVFFDGGSYSKHDPTDIKITNCNDEYFVYYLPNVSTCYSTYCTE